MPAAFPDKLARGLAFMASEVVGDDDIAGGQGRQEAILHPGGEGIAVDRAIQDEGGDNPVVAQPGEEGQGFPVPVRHKGREPFAARAPATGSGHVGLDPCLICKYQSFRIKLVLMGAPPGPEPRHFRAHLFAGHQSFF